MGLATLFRAAAATLDDTVCAAGIYDLESDSDDNEADVDDKPVHDAWAPAPYKAPRRGGGGAVGSPRDALARALHHVVSAAKVDEQAALRAVKRAKDSARKVTALLEALAGDLDDDDDDADAAAAAGGASGAAPPMTAPRRVRRRTTLEEVGDAIGDALRSGGSAVRRQGRARVQNGLSRDRGWICRISLSRRRLSREVSPRSQRGHPSQSSSGSSLEDPHSRGAHLSSRSLVG